MHRSKHQVDSITMSARHIPRRSPDVQRDEFSPLIRSPHALPADLATDDIAEQFPTLALEFPELKLLDRSEVSCAGVERDAGQEPFELQSLDARGLLHDIPAGKIVAARFENMNHRLSNIVASH